MDSNDSETPSVEVQIATGDYHTCALRDGAVRCWGYGEFGQLGYGNANAIGDDETPASAGDVELPGPAVQIAAGGLHTCALLKDGSVYCWGSGFFGQLGYGNTNRIGDDETPTSAGPVDVGGIAIEISAGGSQTCAVIEGGSLRCWGFGGYGSLGLGDTRNIGNDEVPASIPSIDVGAAVTHVECGTSHVCAITDGGGVVCWGSNANGQLGRGNIDDIGDNELPSSGSTTNVGAPVTHLSAGLYHVCALTDQNAARCWGANESGELGYGNTADVGNDEAPSTAGDLELGAVAAVSAGGIFWYDDSGIYFHGHSCGVLTTGDVRCWGNNDHGQLGIADTASIGDNEDPSVTADLGAPAKGIAVGGFHSCAVLESGEVTCWGGNARGQLGRGNTADIGDDETPASAGPLSLWE